ncbi:MAG: hypothetical protein WC823_03230 [Parcubacteria group bacterium]|jgi:hypothetical protein
MGRKHEVNLSVEPQPINERYRVRKHQGDGVVELEKIRGDLYVNGKVVNFFISEGQKRGVRTPGFEVLEELKNTGGIGQNYAMLVYLYDHSELLPDNLRAPSGKQGSSNGPNIYFPGTIFAPTCEPDPQSSQHGVDDWICGFEFVTGMGLGIITAKLCCDWGASCRPGEPSEVKALSGAMAYIIG